MKKPINKCKDKSFVKIPGVSGYLINKKGEIFSEFKGEVMKLTCLMEAARKFNLHCTLISKQVRGKIDNVNGYKFERL